MIIVVSTWSGRREEKARELKQVYHPLRSADCPPIDREGRSVGGGGGAIYGEDTFKKR